MSPGVRTILGVACILAGGLMVYIAIVNKNPLAGFSGGQSGSVGGGTSGTGSGGSNGGSNSGKPGNPAPVAGQPR